MAGWGPDRDDDEYDRPRRKRHREDDYGEFPGRAVAGPTKRRDRRRSGVVPVAIGLGVLGLLIAGAFVVRHALFQQEAGPPPADAPTEKVKFRPGERVTLTGSATFVVKHKFLFPKFVRTVQAQDMVGLKEMADAGLVVLTPDGTRALVISTEEAIVRWEGKTERAKVVELRLEGGPHDGFLGYVPEEFLTRK